MSFTFSPLSSASTPFRAFTCTNPRYRRADKSTHAQTALTIHTTNTSTCTPPNTERNCQWPSNHTHATPPPPPQNPNANAQGPATPPPPPPPPPHRVTHSHCPGDAPCPLVGTSDER